MTKDTAIFAEQFFNMATFLFDEIIFGPVKSRRLGLSLGVNLLPTNVKVCSFDCIYCECGWTPKKYAEKINLPSREKVQEKLKEKLTEMASQVALPDVITFAGNGEPTLHPAFSEIIRDTIELRDQFSPNTRIAVLSNATMLHKKEVFSALLSVEENIQKLDSAFESTINILDCPNGSYNLEKVINQLIAFKGKVIIQTMFVKGTFKEKAFDNTTEIEISAWLDLLKKIKPAQVMIYTIARDTPIETLTRIPIEKLNSIAEKVNKEGIKTQVSG